MLKRILFSLTMLLAFVSITTPSVSAINFSIVNDMDKPITLFVLKKLEVHEIRGVVGLTRIIDIGQTGRFDSETLSVEAEFNGQVYILYPSVLSHREILKYSDIEIRGTKKRID